MPRRSAVGLARPSNAQYVLGAREASDMSCQNRLREPPDSYLPHSGDIFPCRRLKPPPGYSRVTGRSGEPDRTAKGQAHSILDFGFRIWDLGFGIWDLRTHSLPVVFPPPPPFPHSAFGIFTTHHSPFTIHKIVHFVQFDTFCEICASNVLEPRL